MRRGLFAALLLLSAAPSLAQTATPCRLFCEIEFKVEPTFTIENLANRHEVETAGAITKARRDRVFETVLALDLSTRTPWLGFTVEAITAPFADDNDVELEFEANVNWLQESQTRGWVSSHFDIVDQLSPAERPGTERAYSHKLDLELDTAFHVFNFLPEGRWWRGLELETSLDYLATGTPRAGDVLSDGTRFINDASRWSLSFVVVIPVAPF